MQKLVRCDIVKLMVFIGSGPAFCFSISNGKHTAFCNVGNSALFSSSTGSAMKNRLTTATTALTRRQGCYLAYDVLIRKQLISQIEVRNMSYALKGMWYLTHILRNNFLHQKQLCCVRKWVWC